MASLASLVSERRRALGLTQEELARRIGGGIRQSDVSRIERGRVELPRRERLERLARALELPVGELLIRSGWTGADWEATSTRRTDESTALAGHADRSPVPTAAELGPPGRHAAQPMDDARGPYSPRLRDAIARANELYEQSLDVRRRAAELGRLIAEGRGPTRSNARPRPSRNEVGSSTTDETAEAAR
jgi:transcriptional regulator with XRE-family HTH domain